MHTRGSIDLASVDTKANPPRSIWSHPLDDPEYQRAHAKSAGDVKSGHADSKVGHAGEKSGHHASGAVGASDQPHASTSAPHKRGIGEKLKDKMTGCVAAAERTD